MRQQAVTLVKGDTVRLLNAPGMPEEEVEFIGRAGIKVKYRMAALWWFERGITWSSEKIDRTDRSRGGRGSGDVSGRAQGGRPW